MTMTGFKELYHVFLYTLIKRNYYSKNKIMTTMRQMACILQL